MMEKDLLAKSIHLVTEEAKLTCSMAKDSDKNNDEASSVLFGFSKYLEALYDFINKSDFTIFAGNIYTEVKNYLIGKKDYDSTIKEITEYEKAFSNKFLK